MLISFTDVCDNDIHVPGGVVPLFDCVLMGFFWGPKEDSPLHGYHCSIVCKIFYILQPLYLCGCQQKVSNV